MFSDTEYTCIFTFLLLMAGLDTKNTEAFWLRKGYCKNPQWVVGNGNTPVLGQSAHEPNPNVKELFPFSQY